MTFLRVSRRQIALLFSFVAVTAVVLPGSAKAAGAAEAPKHKILFFSKSSGFEHSVISYKERQPSHAEKVLTELGLQNGWEFTFTKDGSIFTPAGLKPFDAVFFYTTGDLTTPGTDQQPPMPADGKQTLIDYVSAGQGLIGTHSASDTFHTANESKKGPDRYRNHGAQADPYVRLLGGEFIKHGAQQKATMRCVDPKFPGLEKVGDGFALKEEWYSLKDFSSDLHVLLVQETDGMKGPDYDRPPYPATWIREQGRGRVFYTSMGHREDVWTDPVFQSVLVGGIKYALGDVKTDATPNLDQVTPGWATNPPAGEPKTKKKN
ncbi:MAG: ThuA domain-containing protein [Chthoniobacteraceae bacterium]